MRCVEEKCPMYKIHDYRTSYAVCELTQESWKRSYSTKPCKVNNVIDERQREIGRLKELQRLIKEITK